MFEIWILWAGLTAFVIHYGIRAARNPVHIFSHPLILSLLMFGILVKSYFEFDEQTLIVFLVHDYYIMTMIYATVCMMFFCVSFEKGLKAKLINNARHDHVDDLPATVITFYVAVIAVVGIVAQTVFAAKSGGLLAFYSTEHMTAGAYDTTTAYLHALPDFLWPALLISYFTWMKSRRRNYFILFLCACIAAALLSHTILFGNRGGIIRFCLIMGSAYVFLNRPTFFRVFPMVIILSVAIAVVLVLPHLRDALHLGSEIPLSEAIERYFASGGPSVGLRTGGHELFFNVATVQAAWSTGTYDYGAAYVYPAVNFVPRVWWPSKPYELEFGVNVFLLTESVTGWYAGKGAAFNAIGHSFLAFSWLGAVAWGIVGYCCARAFKRALDRSSLMNMGFLAASLIAIVYWGTQSFSAFFFGWFFTIAPFYGLRILSALYLGRRRRSVLRGASPCCPHSSLRTR